MKFSRYLIPLAIFLVIGAFLAAGLRLNPREVPSPLIDRPAPKFQVSRLFTEEQYFSTAEMLGTVWLLNVWASWCTACRLEHQILNEFVTRNEGELIGLNYKDLRPDAISWLQELGNPYRRIPVDFDGSVGIDWGVYGVPETFVIDAAGFIRYKHIGPLDSRALTDTILPLVRQLRQKIN